MEESCLAVGCYTLFCLSSISIACVDDFESFSLVKQFHLPITHNALLKGVIVIITCSRLVI